MKTHLGSHDEACLVTGQIINLMLADDYEICAIKRGAGRDITALEFLNFNKVFNHQPESAVLPFAILASA
jgi:hypothetical protein